MRTVKRVTVTSQWRMILSSYCSVPLAKYYEEVKPSLSKILIEAEK